MDSWSPARTSALVFLWLGSKLSSRQIANLLGVTKGSVLGRLHRLHIRREPIATLDGRIVTQHLESISVPLPPQIFPKNPKVIASKAPVMCKEQMPAVEPEKPRRNRPVSLLEAKPWQCRYPRVDDPLGPDFFCGAAIVLGSYCEEHARTCYRPRYPNVHGQYYYWHRR